MFNKFEKLNPAIKLIGFILVLFSIILSKSSYNQLILFTVLCSFTIFYKMHVFDFLNLTLNLVLIYLVMAIFYNLFGISSFDLIMVFIKVVNIFFVIRFLAKTTESYKLSMGVVKLINVFNILSWDWNNLAINIHCFIESVVIFKKVMKKIIKIQSVRGIDSVHCTFIGRFYAKVIAFPNVLRITKNETKIYKSNLRQKLFYFNRNRCKINFEDVHIRDIMFLGVTVIIFVLLFLGDKV